MTISELIYLDLIKIQEHDYECIVMTYFDTIKRWN